MKNETKKSKIILPGQSETPPVQLNEYGTEKFARVEKEKVVPPAVMSNMKVYVPPIYYWEDVEGDTSYKMTMAFQIHGGTFGMSYPIEDQNVVKIDMLRKKLFGVVKESLDVLVHHGKQVLDSAGQINPKLVNEQEAIRWRHDQHWDKKVAAFNKLIKIAPITREKAIKLKLLSESKIFT